MESPGLLNSLRGFADGLVGSAHDRLALLAVELQEEKYRLIQVFIWISAMVLLAVLALVLLSFAVVLLFWDTARLAAVCGLAVAYVLGFVAALIGFRRCLKSHPKPFAATVAELREDRTCIRAEN
jgi:uncharacterized membrane protein YqjE